MAVVPPTIIVGAAVAARRRRILRAFEEAGADQPARARTLEALGIRDKHLASRLMQDGVLATAEGQSYYLSADGLARWNRRRNTYVLIALGVMTLLIAALLLWARSR